ncbi:MULTISPECIES: tRNA nucleotidyltransferase [Psychrobacter]|uniref:tRNA nucleotidyltransferase n=1 Tax=Psychrobacter TaxID=497 RepID=UPI000C337445|nr:MULTISPECIES: tRNA nucleotidyltransferase [Psychrobacter]MBA6243236.1 tRNA nucleotidyltransferase [Psychrobacter sp. Urea-trap-18]MBA6286294.1 tRNA nucleotidyltransferase [Psychrobacter sp. Urea-trap-16]MBA6317443.1 tRNA nucleotidyltransferase [Psychrobacter sp. Urea-trap-20]MBA6334529.1 tRNA nucleotidyltransferase [Psychrobacter sp. Urea-trap-19]PKG60925.1 tRNA nucleotidyltransferase [Psychrobacter sp. Choline-3u-12]
MQIYLVGGAVRDRLLKRPIKDKDFVVVGATVTEMIDAGFQQVGADFPVFLHPTSHEEYALARTERKQGSGYKGFSVHASPDISLEDDLRRRDLTINAMAIEVTSLTDDTPINGQVIDYYGGLQDLKSKTLRHVSSAFSEDPLRVLRTVRFYSRYYDLGFAIADDTLTLMRQLVDTGELAHLSAERIWQESSRATMQLSPQVYWQKLFEIGALTEYFAPLHHAWDNVQIRETVQTALYFAGQMRLNLSQRWALLMTSLSSSLFNSENSESTSNVSTAIKNINGIGNKAKVPKAHTQFATLFAQQAEKLSTINSLNAAEKIDLIQACGAHKEPDKLSQLLVCSHVLQLAIQHRQMMLALNSFHAIGMTDIAPDLKGPAIGAALRQSRIEHLQAQQ